jgi:hypothetical protein
MALYSSRPVRITRQFTTSGLASDRSVRAATPFILMLLGREAHVRRVSLTLRVQIKMDLSDRLKGTWEKQRGWGRFSGRRGNQRGILDAQE